MCAFRNQRGLAVHPGLQDSLCDLDHSGVPAGSHLWYGAGRRNNQENNGYMVPLTQPFSHGQC